MYSLVIAARLIPGRVLPLTAATADDDQARWTTLRPDFFSENQAWCEHQLQEFRTWPLEKQWTTTILDFLLDPKMFGPFGRVHAHMALGLCVPPVPPFFPAIIIKYAPFRYHLLAYGSAMCGLVKGSGALQDPERSILFKVNQRFFGCEGNLALPERAYSKKEQTKVYAVAREGESAAVA